MRRVLDLGSGVAGGAHGRAVGRAGLWGVPPTWVWVVGTSPQILEHPTSICDTGVNNMKLFVVKLACFEHERTCNCFGEMFISQFVIFSIPSQREAK